MRMPILAAAIFAASVSVSDTYSSAPDLKLEAMRVYGVRSAISLDDNTIKVVIGSSSTPARAKPQSYRIVSDGDTAYAYSKFVTPKSVVRAKPPKAEFALSNKALPNRAVAELTRCEVILAVPYPLKKGVAYSVVAQGEGGTMVTAGICAASFVHGAAAKQNGDGIAARMLGLRRVLNIGDGKILCEFGHAYLPVAGLDLSNWNVSVNGKQVNVAAIGRRSRAECYQPTGWPFKVYLEHLVYLDLGCGLKNGDKVSVRVNDCITSGNKEADFVFDASRALSRSIKTNQIGYLPDGEKIAYVGQYLGSFPERAAVSGSTEKRSGIVATKEAYYFEAGKGTQEDREIAAAEAAAQESVPSASATGYDALAPYALRFRKEPLFSVLDFESRRKVFEGRLTLRHNGLEFDGKNNYSGENVYVADFTAFDKPGRYVLSVEGVGISLPFDISRDVYSRAFNMQAKGVYSQRCGCPLDPTLNGGWERVACHTSGVITTCVQRHSAGEWGAFTENMEMDLNPLYPAVKAKREKVEKDPSRVRAPFRAIGKTKRVKNPAFAEVYAAGDAENSNGIETSFAFDPSRGATVSFMVRRDDSLAGGAWGGDLLRLSCEKDSLALGVCWGVVRFFSNYSQRINDGKWHRFFLKVLPAGKDGKHLVQLSVDGKLYDSRKVLQRFANAPEKEMRLLIGAATGDAEGLFIADPMVFARALSDQETQDMVAAVPEKLPRRLHIAGGHHDAGDYNPRCHIDVAQQLLNAYELKPDNFFDGQLSVPERGNGIPDIVDEALWALKIWKGLQDEDGGVRNGTESNGDPNFIQTVELDDKGDYAWAKDAKGSYLAAGAFAQASRILRSFGKTKEAADYLDRAIRAYGWAVKNPTIGIENLAKHGEYTWALRAYAAAHLYSTTLKKRYHEDFIASTPWRDVPGAELVLHGHFDLQLAAYAYALVPEEMADPAIRKAVIGAIRKEADMYIRYSDKMAYKFVKHPYAPITWGTGAYQNFAVPVAWMWCLTGEKHYRDWLIRSCDNTLGANPLGLSWITGIGERTIRCPLHNSRYSVSGVPAVGLQEQGPNKSFAGYSCAETAYPRLKDRFAIMQNFADMHFAIAMNEPTVNNMANTMFVFGLLADASIKVDTNIPAGNGEVCYLRGDEICIRQEQRDSEWWFYWAFRVRGAAGRTVKVVFHPSYKEGPVSARGPAVSRDLGKTWVYAAESYDHHGFVYTFGKDENEVWFSQTIPYLPSDWNAFLAAHKKDKGKFFVEEELCKSRKGQSVPKARFGRIDGKGKYRIWLSARHHCQETMASYVLEGVLDATLSDTETGEWMRENAELMVVPFVDLDGVVAGDQGKNRKPHDHNRDYYQFIYPETRAIRDWIAEYANRNIDAFIDLHCPWVHGEFEEIVFQVYGPVEAAIPAQMKFGDILEGCQDGSLAYRRSQDFPWNFRWNSDKNYKAGACGSRKWAMQNLKKTRLVTTFEIPFANANGKVVDAQSARRFGRDMAKALVKFLKEEPRVLDLGKKE